MTHVSGSPTSAFIRHLGRETAEFNFSPTPGLPASAQMGHQKLLSLTSGSLQSPELRKLLGFPEAFVCLLPGW